MTTAWTMRILVSCCLALPVACVVSVGDGDDPIDNVGGTSGGTNTGSGGSSGNGSSGSGGTEQGGGGTMSMVEMGGSGGAGGSEPAPAVCTPEAGDDEDPCLSCIKQQCCTQWQACNDSTCQEERVDLELCVQELDALDAETYGECVSMVSSTMDFLAPNTQAVMDCVNEEVTGDAGVGTRCGVACFGEDIFF